MKTFHFRFCVLVRLATNFNTIFCAAIFLPAVSVTKLQSRPMHFKLWKYAVRYNSTIIGDRLVKAAKRAGVISSPSLSEDVIDSLPRVEPKGQPPIFIRNGALQYVTPYNKLTYSTVKSFKRNERPMSVIDYFKTMFIGKNVDFIEKQIIENKLYVLRPPESLKSKPTMRNADLSDYERFDGISLFDFELKPFDVIINYVCMHEIAIPYQEEFEVLENNKKLLVVNKPPGIPVHPLGVTYRFNTLQYILSERGYGSPKVEKLFEEETIEMNTALWPVHRLDKETSGIMIFAKNQAAARDWTKLMEKKNSIKKVYLALVHGEFPSKLICKDVTIDIDLGKRYGEGAISKPQFCKSRFTLVHHDKKKNQSLIVCDINTGRKHQIRQHLRNSGFHIVNDPLYGVDGILKEKMVKPPNRESFESLRQEYQTQLRERALKWEAENICKNCGHVTYYNPTIGSDEKMRLHSFHYSHIPEKDTDPSYIWQTEIPNWANEILPSSKRRKLTEGFFWQPEVPEK